jgi:succinate dehydrogenase / fumarate reductase cytochrome b subunit
MNKTSTFLQSSVGKKIIMSLSGLFLCSFLVIHLYINLFLFKQDNGQSFDVYAEFMATYPLLRPIEIILFAGFILHAVIGVWLWLQNRRARPVRYKMNEASENSPLASRATFITGTAVFIFLIIHINTFFVQSRFFPTGITMYERVAGAFQNPMYDAFYIAAIGFLSYHLKHGFQSAFQTLGIRNRKQRFLIDTIAVIFWLFIPIGFAAMPLYFLWFH